MAQTQEQNLEKSDAAPGRAPRRGRPPSSPLDRARREAMKAKRRLEEADSKFFERLSLDESDPERASAVKLVANRRMRQAKVVNDARSAVLQARADVKKGVPGAAARLESAKQEELAAWEKFRELPELGFTQEEWDSMDKSLVQRRGLGRPQLDIEITRVRAKEAFDAALELVKREEEAAGEKHVPLSKLKDPVKHSGGMGLGRPKLDQLGVFDRKLNMLEKKIEQLKREAEQPGTDVPAGPRTKTPAAKLIEARQKADELRRLIEAEEAKLDEIGRVRRHLKRLRDESRRMTIAIRDNPDNSEAEQQRKAWLAERIEERMAELKVLEEKAAAQTADETPDGPREAAHQAPVEPTVPEGLDRINAEASAVTPSRPDGQPVSVSHRTNVVRRRAEVRAQAADVDAKYAQMIAKLYQDFDEELAATFAETIEQKRLAERAQIEGIELLED